MTNNKARLRFSPKALPIILKAFGKTIDESGAIRDMETGEIVLAPEGDELTRNNLGAIKKGSQLFLKKDLLSAIKLKEGKY